MTYSVSTKLSISVFALALAFLFLSNTAFASEITGTLTTGIEANLGDTVQGIVVVPPSASPVSGTYSVMQSIALNATGATSIHYTTDGTNPTCMSGQTYSGVISVTQSQTIKAISCYAPNGISGVVSFAYTLTPAGSSGGSGGGGGGGGGSGGSVFIPTSSAVKKGDATKDNKIDVFDFVSLMANWGKTGASNVADFNSDGKVDIFDFVAVMANWGK